MFLSFHTPSQETSILSHTTKEINAIVVKEGSNIRLKGKKLEEETHVKLFSIASFRIS